ncbi:hypothetical protein BJ165DRAFT_1482368 [Panaeolus papilionaceus]|nr:hypothetical protein BJ165DRAFT_1482368 [Panaeolus papilionaceus]
MASDTTTYQKPQLDIILKEERHYQTHFVEFNSCVDDFDPHLQSISTTFVLDRSPLAGSIVSVLNNSAFI